MSYLDLIQKEGIDSQYLIILAPKIVVSGFTLHSGSVYKKSFDYGYPISVSVDGVDLTKGTSTTLSAGQWYFEDDFVYLRKSDSTSPISNMVVVTYELYYGTKDEHWYRDPLNNTTDSIYFEAKIQRSPEIKSDISDSIFGFQPVQRSSVSIINTDHSLEKHVYAASFSKSSIKMYHILRESPATDLDIANIKLVYDGLLQDVNYDNSTIKIETVSGEDELSIEYRNSNESFYSTSLFPNLDPQEIGSPIRYVYGVVDGFIPINISYVDYQTATTSDNRTWSCIGEQNNLNNVTASVGGGVHTTTRTYLTSLLGLRVGDSVFMDRASGTDEYKIITAIGSTYIEHSALVSPMTNGDTVKRSFVGSITIVQNNQIYTPLFNRDYVSAGALAGGCAGFTFTNNFEATLGMSTLTPNDRVICRVYGRKNDLTLGGPSFGANDTETNNIANPIMVILDLMKNRLSIPESRLNTASFTSAYSNRSDALGFAIPQTKGSNFPKYKDLLLNIIQTSLVRIYIDDDLKWTIGTVDPLGAITRTIADDEIVFDSIQYSFSYKDVFSDILVEYRYRETTENLQNAGERKSVVSAISALAKNLHQISKQKNVKSFHFKESDAQTLADRLSYFYGDRAGQIVLRAKNRFFLSEIGDVLEVERTKMPGFEFDADIDRTKLFSLSSIVKNRTSITLVGFDQKGIEENSGSW